MKNCLVLCLASLISLSVFGQKQSDGSIIAELNFTPFGESPLSVNGLKFRFFGEENFAIRSQLNIATTSSESVISQAGELVEGSDSNAEPVMMKASTFDFSFAPGVELHTGDADRVSPYFGAYFLIGAGNSEVEAETWGPIDVSNVDVPANWQNWSTIQTTPYASLGLGLLSGVDFYFSDNIYLGAEIALAFERINWKDTETTFSNLRGYQLSINPGDPGAVDTPAPLVNGKDSSFGPSVNGAIRLGYIINGR